MLASKVIAQALQDTHTDEEDFIPETEGLTAYNIIRNRVLNEMVQVKDDYFWDRGETDLVTGQSEYVIQYFGEGSDKVLIKKINKIFVKYKSDSTYFTPVEYSSTSTMNLDPDYYSDNQPESAPFFNIKDQSVFIYPAPLETISGGIKFNGIYMPKELEYEDFDEKVDEDKQYIISLGIAELIYKSQGKINEKNDARAEYSSELKKFIGEIKARYNKPVKKTFNRNIYK